jgi:hypothetical protein
MPTGLEKVACSSSKQYILSFFAALECAFGLMPSSSRIAEQAHGGIRDGVSLLSTDMQRSYITNEGGATKLRA